MAADPNDGNASVAVAVAVLAGIAAADAACCGRLGQRSRGENHHDAEILLQQIVPGGREAAKALHGLLDLKSTAHYGFSDLNRDQVTRSIRQAKALVAFADGALRSA